MLLPILAQPDDEACARLTTEGQLQEPHQWPWRCSLAPGTSVCAPRPLVRGLWYAPSIGDLASDSYSAQTLAWHWAKKPACKHKVLAGSSLLEVQEMSRERALWLSAEWITETLHQSPGVDAKPAGSAKSLAFDVGPLLHKLKELRTVAAKARGLRTVDC